MPAGGHATDFPRTSEKPKFPLAGNNYKKAQETKKRQRNIWVVALTFWWFPGIVYVESTSLAPSASQ